MLSMKGDIQRYRLTYILLASSSVVYLFSALLSQSLSDMDMQVLVDMGALFGPLTVLKGEWWRLLTAMFLHGGMTHLLMNMFSLYLVGRGAEMYFDTKSYLSIYFFSGIIGGLVSLYIHPVSVGVGASGAIFGVFGALAGFFLAHREKIASHTKAFMKDFSIIIAINLVIGFSIPSIDVSAHIGGLIVGFIGGFVLSKDPKWIWGYSSAMVLLILAIISYLPDHYAKILF
ncbi:rhomboid family intramembrane serine protease [Sulfurovum sp. AR]|uniref:rhomboid family intramembrane serine protease n=1 Tax=Sulfurovum sp. AR TaxID=1165841 RepID=UPI001EE68BA1|nr:rhomboid family intramembrane serine protease [Sulfurovum sp. AR]